MSQVKLNIGNQSAIRRPAASGGSTTVGGVSSSTRKSTVNALAKLFEVVGAGAGRGARSTGGGGRAHPGEGQSEQEPHLEGRLPQDGHEQDLRDGREQPAQAAREGLNTSGAAGVQIADVSVDTETGIVKINRFVAVQDCGLIINPRLADSQIYGAIIMGIGTALFEERIMDEQTGAMLNADMEFYKLAGIDDIGEIVVHLDDPPRKR